MLMCVVRSSEVEITEGWEVDARATKQNLGWRPLTIHCQHREHTELVSPWFNEGDQMLPEGDQSWRLSPFV